MKTTKLILLLVIALTAILSTAKAQTYDTITGPNGRLNGFYYTKWFDTCDVFYDDTMYNGCSKIFRDNYMDGMGLWRAYPLHLDYPALIKGYGVMTDSRETNPNWYYSQLSTSVLLHPKPRVAEYVHLWSGEPAPRGNGTTYIDSSRWDTAAVKIYKFPKNYDSARYGFIYVGFSQVYLDTPIYVDAGTHLLAGSNNNNGRTDVDGWHPYEHIPTSYFNIQIADPVNCGADDDYYWLTHLSHMWWDIKYYHGNKIIGPILPMIDFANVHTLTADSTMGLAHPNGKVPKDVYQTIYADPHRGYSFLRWNDGDTNNPRRIFLSQDTTFTATFTDLPIYRVKAKAEPVQHGIVRGGGIYYEGETVVLTAVPAYPYRFSHWQDGDTINPRTFNCTGDTNYTAYFVEKDTFSLSAVPNFADRGTVSGSGTYHDGDTAVLTATAEVGYRFSYWTDNNFSNPRRVVVTQDTAFTAQFSQWRIGIDEAETANTWFSLTPNPAHGSVTVEMKDPQFMGQGTTLTLTDMSGRILLTQEVHRRQISLDLRQYAAGTYYVTLTSPQGTHTGKLVIK